MTGSPDQYLIEDVCEASASCLLDALPDLASLAPTEAFARLRLHMMTAFLAYHDGLQHWHVPEDTHNRG